LVGEAVGEVELEENVLVIKRIHVRMWLKAEWPHRETATRVQGMFGDKCPVYRSLKAAIAIMTELILESPAAERVISGGLFFPGFLKTRVGRAIVRSVPRRRPEEPRRRN
jgi:hypothetical protein